MGATVTITDFIMRLAEERMPDVFNPWAERDPLDRDMAEWARRRVRLAKHLACTPVMLLIGEAPGYQGCRFSGVPFTNEALLCDGTIPRLKVAQRITTRPRPWREPSATIMWGALHEHGIAHRVVLWNAFPYHPHRPGQPHSNRRPTRKELEAQGWALDDLLRLYRAAPAVAVGRIAERALADLGITPKAALRHPAMGGAPEFRRGLRALVRELA